MPLTLYDGNGNYLWDTDNVRGGVLADVRKFSPNEGGTFNYPSFAGRTAHVMSLSGVDADADANGWTLDYDQGYPRVTIAAVPQFRRIAVLVL